MATGEVNLAKLVTPTDGILLTRLFVGKSETRCSVPAVNYILRLLLLLMEKIAALQGGLGDPLSVAYKQRIK